MMINLRKSFLDSLEFVNNKTAILRIDLNLPIFDGKVSDFTRMDKITPTIKGILNRNGKIIIISHLGRPKGINNKELSLKQLVPFLEEKIESKITFCNEDIFGKKIERIIKKMVPKDILLLENIRFYHQEEENDLSFSKRLASFGDIFINESFSTSHRNHSSISGIGTFLPSFPGSLFEFEIKNLSKIFRDSNRKTVAVLGGSKISTKLNLIDNLAKKFDKILIGGAMANTFLSSQGIDVGNSLKEPKLEQEAKQLLNEFKEKIIIPDDVIVVNSDKPDSNLTINVDSLSGSENVIMDIGPKTRKNFYNLISKSEILLWNGPLGYFEKIPFDNGSNYVASIVKVMHSKKFFSVAGGGDTISCIKNSGFYEFFSFISTGGGAFLELIEGKNLPGIEILNN